jgi:hypothetical protein
MIIPITFKPPSDGGRQLPPQLADLGNGHLVLIELQGSLEVQGPTDSQFVGTLTIDPKTVCTLPATTVEPRDTDSGSCRPLEQALARYRAASAGGKDRIATDTARSHGEENVLG